MVRACNGRVDPNDSRRVVVEEFRVVFEDGSKDIVYRLDTPMGIEHMRTTPFVLAEAARYKFAVSFRVNRAIVSGLRFRNKVKKTVLSNTDEVVLGSYAPRSTPYEFVYPRHDWLDTPSGMFYRGKYMAQFRLVDDDKAEHIKNYYTFGACVPYCYVGRPLGPGRTTPHCHVGRPLDLILTHTL